MSGKPTFEELRNRVKELEDETSHLEKERNRFRSLAENTSDWIWEIDRDGFFTYSSPKVKDLLGYDPKEVLGKTPFDFMPAPEATRLSRLFRDIVESGEPFEGLENLNIHKDGRMVVLETSGVPILDEAGHLSGYRGVDRDIAERKQAQEALSWERNRAQRYLDLADVIIVAMSTKGEVTLINRKGCEVLGYTEEEVLGKNWFNNFLPERIIAEVAPVSDVLLSGKTEGAEYFENPILTKQGEERLIAWHNTVLRDDQGGIIGHLSSGEDITDRKRTEESLSLERDFNTTLIQRSPTFFVAMNSKGKIRMMNQTMMNALGYHEDEVIGQEYLPMFVPQKDHETLSGIFENLIEGKTTQNENHVLTKDGQELLVEWRGTPIFNKAHELEYFFGIGINITERKRAEQERKHLRTQLQQAQKMEAIGTLAGGIAHDFNNILSSIFGFTELAKMKLSAGERIEKDLDSVLDAGFRARDLVRQILAFSRQTNIEKNPIDLNPIIKESLKFLRASLPSTIEMRVNIDISESTVIADPTQIHQVIMNLCTNAAHAMNEKGGTIDVRLDEVLLEDDGLLYYKELTPGRYIRLSIGDTGHGTPKELIDRIFDPFFTTKERGEGTGMGLSVVHGIIKDFGGDISVYSEVGHGTTFRVLLPRHVGEKAAELHIPESAIKEGRGRILFVDDEEAVLSSGVSVLRKLGYEVVTSGNGPQALETFKKSPDNFDLVLTDLIMPQMTGLELSRKLIKIRPDIPIVLCTGFGVDLTPKSMKEAGILQTVRKPILFRELSEAISQVLLSET